MVTAFIIEMKREDLFDGLAWSPPPKKIIHAPFDMRYSIPRTHSKNIGLETQKDYEAMMSEATLKARPTVVLIVTEIKVHFLLRPISTPD